MQIKICRVDDDYCVYSLPEDELIADLLPIELKNGKLNEPYELDNDLVYIMIHYLSSAINFMMNQPVGSGGYEEFDENVQLARTNFDLFINHYADMVVNSEKYYLMNCE